MDLERRGKIGRLTRLRLAAVLLMAAASLPLSARPLQADATTALLSDISGALERADADAFRALGAPQLSLDSTLVFFRMTAIGRSRVVLRERQRDRNGVTTKTVVDLFASREQAGRLATWEITSRASATRNGRDEIVAVSELGAVDGLRRLALDTRTAYSVHNFSFTAPDVTFRMTRGIAFMANSGAGNTALVLHGDGQLTFAPPLAAEQAQLRLFAGRPSLTTTFSDAFIRVPPGTLESAITGDTLRATRATSSDSGRATALFADRAARTFTLNLGDLAGDSWSLDPPAGSAVVEFRTPAHGWLTYTRTPGDVEDVALFDRMRRRQISLYASAGQHEAQGAMREMGYDVRHYDLDIRIDPARAFVTARAMLTVRLTQPAAGGLTLRLAEPLLVSSVSSPQLGRLLPVRVVGQDQLLVTLPGTVPVNSDVRIDIAYSGRLESQTLARETLEFAAQEQDESAERPRLPPTSRFVLSVRRAWYPQVANDYATASLRVTVPDDVAVVASGRRDDGPMGVGSTLAPPSSGAWRTTRFETDRPVRYLACVISRWIPMGTATAALPGTSPDRRVVVDAMATPPQAKASADLAAQAARILMFYAAEVGDAPYPTFTAASIDDDLPGGHSPAYFALIQQPRPSSFLSWRDDPVAFDQVPDFVLAHEIAHQWWGQAVGYSSYHDQWLSEGLAQYFALRYIAATRSASITRNVMAHMRSSVKGLEGEGPISLGYRLGHIRAMPRVFRAVLYNKSALVLDMLRELIGDASFSAGLRDFYARSRFRSATTNELRAAFERASGQPLNRFFERWIHGAALPQLRVSWRQVDPRTLTVRVEQIGDVFDVSVPILLEYVDGRSAAMHVTSNQRASDTRIPLESPIRRVRVDRDLTMARW
ncbi:MAG: M1 family aminopeptidase [Acidobacteriota bacterium]